MTDSTITVNVTESLNVHSNLTAKITFNIVLINFLT